MDLNSTLTPRDLLPAIDQTLELAAEKNLRLDHRWKASDGAPVITIKGQYTARSWTQWTQGFQYGNALLCFDMTGDQDQLDAARRHVSPRHGRAPQPYRRPRSRLQQHLHLRQPPPPYARRPHPPERVGIKFLRARPQSQRRCASRALDPTPGQPGLHLLLQRQPLPVHRHHPHPAHLLHGAPARPHPAGRTGQAHRPPRTRR